ncbi:MAG: glycosyltransferase family 4 protein [Pseudomonadota bacterium]
MLHGLLRVPATAGVKTAVREAQIARVGRPFIVLLYSANEPVGRRGGGIRNAVISQAVGLMRCGVDVQLLTSSEGCGHEASRLGIPTKVDPNFHSGLLPLLSAPTRRICLEAARRSPAAVIHNSGRTWFAGNMLFPRSIHTQVLHREVVNPYRFFRKWIALSERYADELRRGWSGMLRQIAVAPNGLVETPAAMDRRVNGGPLTVGVIGRLGRDDVKGMLLMLDAASVLKNRGVNARFRVAGPELGELQYETERRGLSDQIEFAGWVDDINGFLKKVDVFCLPSRKEAFGIVLLEAMANSVPVVATDTNGSAEVVIDGVTGTIVPREDPEALATAIATMAEQPELALSQGRRGLDRVCSTYMPEHTGQRLIAALEELGAAI